MLSLLRICAIQSDLRGTIQTCFVALLKELIVILIVTFDGVEVVVVVAVDEVPIEEVVPAVVVQKLVQETQHHMMHAFKY